MPRYFAQVLDFRDFALDDAEGLLVNITNDVVDDEDIGRRNIGVKRCANFTRSGRDDLHLLVGASADLFEQIEVRRFSHRNREHFAHEKQRQHQVLEQILARKNLKAMWIGNARDIAGERNTVAVGNRSHHIVISHEAKLNQRFAEKSPMALLLLVLERVVELLGRDESARNEQLAELQARKSIDDGLMSW